MQYFEDIVIGARREVGSYTFTAERIKAFARKYDPQPFHLDEAAGKASLFGGLAASGWHTAAAAMRCGVDSRARERAAAQARGDDAPAGGPSPGFKNLRWPKPVLAGDTVTFFTEVKSTRPSVSRPQWGLVFFLNTGVNQRGELVFSFEGSGFVPRRPGANG